MIVVDHGSTDGTLELVRNRFPGVRVLEQENLRHGRRQQRGYARGGRPLLAAAQLRRLGVRRRAAAAGRVRRRSSRGGRRRPEAPQHRRHAAALGAPGAHALAGRDRVPVHPQARAALRPAQPALRRRFRPRELPRSRLALGGRPAGAPGGGRRGRAVRRELLPVQRGGRLADALPPCRLAGVVLPGRRGRACRRRIARRPDVRREPSRPAALLRQASRGEGSRAVAAPAARGVAHPCRRPAAARVSRGRALSPLRGCQDTDCLSRP